METVLISGGTGMIGSALSAHLTGRGYSVIILTRHAPDQKPRNGISYASWDPAKGTMDATAFSRADHLVHLAGANVGEGRWTKKRKEQLVRSRVDSGQLLVHALRTIPNRIRTVISASGIGYYGPDPVVPNPRPFTESDPPFSDFLSSVVKKWEAAILPAAGAGRRLVILRAGPVLSREGGAYAEFRKPLRFGLTTVLGSGRQIVSWISLHDAVRLYTTVLKNEQWEGVYNAVSPHPVTNRELVKTMARHLRGPHLTTPVPAFVLKLLFGEMSIEVLKSTTVSCSRLLQNGFVFEDPDIDTAVRRLEQN